jgi:ceramide glucosyltransferase
VIESVALAALAVSAAAYVVSAAAALRMRRRSRGAEVRGTTPPVSILKPLAGSDEGLEEDLESYYRLDYETFELVFSFASRDDPAFRVARAVADRHPERPATFVFDAREPGGNAKVNRLAAAMPYARHRLLLMSDGNVRVRPDFLRRAVSPFVADPRMGLVSNLFRACGARSVGSRIETLYLNGCLLPGTAAVATVLRMPCVVGKSILVSRRALESIGGIATLRNHLAEDYLLGKAIRSAGFRVALSADVLDTTEVSKPLRAVWARHRRWALMRRRLAGPLYASELFTAPFPWFVAAVLAADGAAAVAAASGLLALRWGAELALARAEGHPVSLRDAALLPARDVGAFALFWAGLFGREVKWRGREVVIGPQTRIESTT